LFSGQTKKDYVQKFLTKVQLE